jgi:hypothetical protein
VRWLGRLRRGYERRRKLDARRFTQPFARPAWVPAPRDIVTDYWPTDARGVLLFGRWWPSPVDWHTDPVHGVRWPSDLPTSRIPIRKDNRPGDVLYVWEPARFLHLFDRPASATEEIAAWIEQSPIGFGVHWDNGLEAASRAICWSFADGGGHIEESLRPALHTALWQHGRFIANHLSPVEYNHYVGDAAGLVVLGASYPDMPDAARWKKRGAAILRKQIARQVLRDGSHAEQSPAYACFVANFYLLCGHLLSDDQLLETAGRILESLWMQMTPDGDLPGYADDAHPQVLWSSRPADRLAILLGVAGNLLDRPEWPCPDRAAEVLQRVFGRDAQRSAGTAPPARALLADSGIVVWREADDWLLFKCGPIGAKAHGHADLLSVLARGSLTLLDPGTPTYNQDHDLRIFSTGTSAHNTVCVDGLSQVARPRRHTREGGIDGEGLVVDESAARGFVCYRDVRHERRVERSAGSIVLLDTVECSGDHELTVRLLGRGLRPALTGWEVVRDGEATFSPTFGESAPAQEILLRARMTDRFAGRIELTRG